METGASICVVRLQFSVNRKFMSISLNKIMVSFYLEMIRNIISETKQLRIFREVVGLPEPPVADTVAVSGFLGQHNIALQLCNDRLLRVDFHRIL